MNTYLKYIAPIGCIAALSLSSEALASDPEKQSVAVQAETQVEDVSTLTAIAYEAALINAANKTLDENKDWFAVSYRDVQTQTVTRNTNNSAESRYLDMENGERVELEIPTQDVKVQVQKIDFEMGEGPKPDSENSFLAEKIVLPES